MTRPPSEPFTRTLQTAGGDDSVELLTRVVELLQWAKGEGWQVRSLQTSDFSGNEYFAVELWRTPPAEPETAASDPVEQEQGASRTSLTARLDPQAANQSQQGD